MNSFRIHKINPQKLVTEIFKVMKDVKLSNDCSLKNELKFHSVRYDIKQHLLMVLEPWTVYLVTLKSVNTLNFSSQKSKKWTLGNCPWKLCQTYLHQIGLNNDDAVLYVYMNYMYLCFSDHVYMFMFSIVQLCLYVCHFYC